MTEPGLLADSSFFYLLHFVFFRKSPYVILVEALSGKLSYNQATTENFCGKKWCIVGNSGILVIQNSVTFPRLRRRHNCV